MLQRRDLRIAAVLYVLCAAVYAATAAGRLRGPSSDTHFVYMAETWLKHRLDLGRNPPHANDWAEVETLTLHDGSKIDGAFQRQNPGRFRPLRGAVRSIADSDIVKREKRYYVSFPPLPAVLTIRNRCAMRLLSAQDVCTGAIPEDRTPRSGAPVPQRRGIRPAVVSSPREFPAQPRASYAA